jgi:hypothetical protein
MNFFRLFVPGHTASCKEFSPLVYQIRLRQPYEDDGTELVNKIGERIEAIGLFLKMDGRKIDPTDLKQKDLVDLPALRHPVINQSEVGSGTSGSMDEKPVAVCSI